MTQSGLVYLGIGIAASVLASILWSIAFPKRRLWPPKRYTAMTPILVWVPTFTLFGILILLGIWDWNEFNISNWARFGIGPPLLFIGNVIVWREVMRFGVHQTGGAKGELHTVGIYRYSRNPQYMADIFIIIGWMILSAAPSVLLVGFAVIVVLICAPFSEEPWLRDNYGEAYETYALNVRRFF